MGEGEFYEQGIVSHVSLQVRGDTALPSFEKNGAGKGIFACLDHQFGLEMLVPHRIALGHLHATFWEPKPAGLSDDLFREAVQRGLAGEATWLIPHCVREMMGVFPTFLGH